MGHHLELKVIAAGVLKEHGQLLAGQANKANVRLDDKLRSKRQCEHIPLFTTKMRNQSQPQINVMSMS